MLGGHLLDTSAPRVRSVSQRKSGYPIPWAFHRLRMPPDDAATGEAWLTFFRRAHRCGALTTAELEPAGLTPADFALSSFVDVMKARR